MTKKQHVTKSGDTFEWEETDEVREAIKKEGDSCNQSSSMKKLTFVDLNPKQMIMELENETTHT